MKLIEKILTNSKQTLLDTAGKFFFNDRFDVVTRNFFVLDESLPKLLITAGHEDLIELRFVRTPLFFTYFKLKFLNKKN